MTYEIEDLPINITRWNGEKLKSCTVNGQFEVLSCDVERSEGHVDVTDVRLVGFAEITLTYMVGWTNTRREEELQIGMHVNNASDKTKLIIGLIEQFILDSDLSEVELKILENENDL